MTDAPKKPKEPVKKKTKSKDKQHLVVHTDLFQLKDHFITLMALCSYMDKDKKIPKVPFHDMAQLLGPNCPPYLARQKTEQLKAAKYKDKPIIEGDSTAYSYQIVTPDIYFKEV